LAQKLKDWGVPARAEDYNSNNSWGFGGSRGIQYFFSENLSALIAFAGTRHRGEFPFITVTYKGDRVFDESGHNKATFQKAKELVHKLLTQDKENV